jgi:hypothetical protein
LIDTYLVVFLLLASLSLPWQLPARQTALLTIPCLLLVLIMSFGSLYIANKRIERTAGSGVQESLREAWDAAYFSTVTITTLGYGDWAPTETGGRQIVIWELLSGATLLLFLVPILASRLALLDEPVGGLTTIGITRLRDGGWRIALPGVPLQTVARSEALLLKIYPDGSVTHGT